MTVKFKQDEYIIHQVRRHWFHLFNHIFISLIFLVLPVFIYAISDTLSINFTAPGSINVLFLFLYATWILIIWIIIMIMWTDYFLDVWIITNKRLINVEQKGMFRREIASVDLRKIQDVTSSITGIIPTLMKFGNLSVQTAGKEKEFIIENIENPGVTSHKLINAVRDAVDNNPQNTV